MKTFLRLILALAASVGVVIPSVGADSPGGGLLEIERQVSHGYATNGGVGLHYAALGKGPPSPFIPGRRARTVWRRSCRGEFPG